MESDHRCVTRRSLVKTVGAGSLASYPQVVKTHNSDGDADDLSALFAELHVRFDYPDLIPETDHYDPLDFYDIKNESIHLRAATETMLDTFRENHFVVKYGTFQGLPKHIPRRDIRTIERLERTSGTRLHEAVSLPPIHLIGARNELIVQVNGTHASISPGSAETIEVASTNAKSSQGDEFEAVAVLSARNHGRKQIKTDTVTK